VELAIAIARKIVHREICTRSEAILDIVREAMGKAQETARIKIRVNPSDFGLLESRKSELSADFDAGDSLVFEEDEKIEKGGCYIETGFGDIDARIEQRILSVEAALRKEWVDSGGLEGGGAP
jgi:flagellar assembly protein FliH